MRARARGLAPDLWLLAVSLAAGLGTARLTRAPGAAHVVGPIVATVVAGHLATSLARRLRGSVAVATAAGVVAVVLATLWGQLLSATRHGLPTPGTWRTVVSRFEAAGAVIRSHPTPVPATAGVVLCIATGAGLVAVLTRGIWSWQEARGGAAPVTLLPTFGLFCYTALLSSQVDRVPGALSYLVGALGFVIVADHSASRARSAPRRVATTLRALLPAAVAGSLAVVVPLAAIPVLTTLKVDALPFTAPAGKGGAAGLGPVGAGPGLGAVGTGGDGAGSPGITGVRAIDLVDNIRAVLVNRTTEVMFSARTPLPTYWQLAVLTRFNGTAWLPDPTTQAAAQSIALPPPSRPVPFLPALPEPEPGATFHAQVTIADLESTLLPLPPTTVSVDTDADVVPGFGAVQPVEASPGLRYVAVARVPTSPTAARHPSTGAATVSAAALAPYLALPAEPPQVVTLAHRIVAGARGPAAQAAALARWFDNGRFRYTLSPPAPTGSDALESFLLRTRAGFCQQFAAAYAVLARIAGLPTRVAVGFTTGASRGHGGYVVTGADAHVWPEVYLGPATGWTSYEPTPSLSGQATGVGVNSGSRGGAQNPGARSTATTASTVATIRHPFSANVSVPATTPLRLHGTAPSSAAATKPSNTALEVGASGAFLAALALAGLWLGRAGRRGQPPLLLRRRRRPRRRSTDPTAEVLAQWRDAETALERARLGRRPAETLEEHATRLRSLASAKWLTAYRPVTPGQPTSGGSPAARRTTTDASIDAGIDAYGKLAALAARASYASGPCSAGEADDAEALAEVVRSGLTGPTGRRGVLAPF